MILPKGFFHRLAGLVAAKIFRQACLVKGLAGIT
jgi:hypothetical protein